MKNISNYYMEDNNNIICERENIITLGKSRISVLTPRLVRIEYNENGVFEDRPTSRIVNRRFDKFEYAITESETMIEINTGVLTLTYVKNSPIKAGRVKAVMNDSKVEWTPGSGGIKNLRSINYSIDSMKDKIVLDRGLYSLDGYAVLDDSKSLVLDDHNIFVERDKKIFDIYLFMYGNDFDSCLRDYFALTGYPSLIPRYALGAWWYKNDKYNENDIFNLINRFKNESFPISVFMLGNNMTNGYAPIVNCSNISNYLRSNNIRLGVTINPTNYVDNNKNSFIPFTNNKVGAYLNNIINNYNNVGVDIFSIDYNNINDKINLWKLDHYHSGAMNMRGKRNLTLARNHGFAMHRYPVMWSGKTKVNFYTLNLLPRYNLQGYNVGVSFIAHPIGGYSNGIEEDELYLRYVEFACFSPIFLLASEGGLYYRREPWKWNYILKEHITYYMNLRYKLIPYLYNESYRYHKEGKGLVKPFYFDYPKMLDEPLYQNQYFFGSDFFVAPITERKNKVINRVFKKIFVPNGIWFDFLKGKKYIGNKYYNGFYNDEDYPVFVKAGSIIPMSYDIKEDIPSTLEVAIYPLANGSYDLYEDDGVSYNYEKGLYMITNFSYEYNDDDYTFIIKKKDGKNLLNKRNYILRFKNIRNITEVNVNDGSIKYNTLYQGDDFVINVENLTVGSELIINIKGKNTFINYVSYINEEIREILYDLEIDTGLKEKIDSILFSNLDIKKKRIQIRKLKRKGLDKKYIKIFIYLLEYIQKI